MDKKIDFDFVNVREKYIPIRIAVILNRILLDPALKEKDRIDFTTFTKMTEERFHFDFFKQTTNLRADFVPFDPDRDTIAEPVYGQEDRQKMGEELIDGLKILAVYCNFIHLSEEELNRCLQLQPGGLSIKVDLSEFQSFHVFYRGVREEDVPRKKWQIWLHWKQRKEIILKRVFVLAQYLNNDKKADVVAKLFKDVPIENIKIIAPKVSFSMPIFDKCKVGGSLFFAIGSTVTKLAKLAALTGEFLWVFVTSCIVVSVKGFVGFFNSRTKYMHKYSSSLYFQSLSSNSSAISALVQMAEEQETKEMILATYILMKHPEKRMSASEIDREAEQWIWTNFQINIDFEIRDALRKLEEKNMLKTEEGDSGEKMYRIGSLQEVLEKLDKDWDNFYIYNK